MTRKEVCLWMFGAVLQSGVLVFSGSGRAQQAKAETRQQQGLDQALIQAVRKHDAKMVRLLLARGANANARDRSARPDRNGTVRPPVTNGPPNALMVVFDASTVSAGKSVNGERRTKVRPDPAEIVRALLGNGADPNVLDYDGKFPLLAAVENRYTASARLLLKHGAKVNQTWVHGITPLHIAAGNKDIPTVKLLMANGADAALRSAFDNPAHPLDAEVRELLDQASTQQNERLRR